MYSVGVDLGGTNISVGVVDENMKIVGRGRVKTALPRPAQAIFESIKEAVMLAVADAGISYDEVKSVGIGTPGSVNKSNGYIEYSNNLEFNQVPAKEMLEALLEKEVFLDNDANCAALGEAVGGCGKGVSSLVAITLGTGVGSGVIVDGKIVNGANGCAGEIGHTVIAVDGVPCNCGRKGCWESYSSATALIRMTKEAMQAHPESAMWQNAEGSLDNVNGRTSFDCMQAGDAVAKEVVDTYVRYLAAGVTNVINALQPEVLCIGGGVGHQKENLLVPLRAIVEKERYSRYSAVQTRIISAELGNDAGIIGAAALTE